MAEIRAKPTWLHARALRSILISIVFASLLALPALIGKSWLNITIEILIMALAACSLNLMLGYTGLVSFGPAGPNAGLIAPQRKPLRAERNHG